jgi:putative membrane protein
MSTTRGEAYPSKPAESTARRQAATNFVLWAIIVLYAVARVLQAFPGKVPVLAIIALHVFPPIVFALVHGTRLYGFRGIFVFAAVCFVFGNISENLGILTGFPFGHYYFTDVMGPKLFRVPVLLGLAYVGMGYLSWTLGSLILGGIRNPLRGSRVVTLPLIAGFIMVAWDLSNDPIWSTIEHAWIWRNGGAYFGVPVVNFLGWYLTVYVIYQLFALYLRGRSIDPNLLPSSYWHLAVLFYGVSAAGNILLAIQPGGLSVVSDPTGAQWKVSDIIGACALVSIFTMGAFALLAFVRHTDRKLENL